MRLLRQVACVVGVVALASCADDGNEVIVIDGQCDGSYDILPPEVGDPASRTRIVIDAVCELGELGLFDVQTFQIVDDNGNGTANLTGSSIYTDDLGNELFSDFVGTSSDTDTGVTFGGTEVYEGGFGEFGAATGSADLSGLTRLSNQSITYLVQGEVQLN